MGDRVVPADYIIVVSLANQRRTKARDTTLGALKGARCERMRRRRVDSGHKPSQVRARLAGAAAFIQQFMCKQIGARGLSRRAKYRLAGRGSLTSQRAAGRSVSRRLLTVYTLHYTHTETPLVNYLRVARTQRP